jgi:hypothetical protein
MALVKDLSGNGSGVDLNRNGRGDAVDISSTDYTINGNRLYATGAGNAVLRYPGSTADITVPMTANSIFPVAPGTIVRKTNTTATGLFSVPA